MRRWADILFLILSDGVAFAVAGQMAMILAIMLERASSFSAFELLTFHSRERFSDLIYGFIAWLFWFIIIKRRHIRRIPFWSETAEVSRAIALMALINLALIALSRNDYSRSIWFLSWLSLIPLIPLTRILGRSLIHASGVLMRNTWIVGTGQNAQEARLAIESEWQMGFRIVGALPCEALLEQKWQTQTPRAPNPDEDVFVIALDGDKTTEISEIISRLTLSGFRDIHVIPSLRGVPLYGTDVSYFLSHEVLLLSVRNNLERRLSRMIKFGFDKLFAILLLVPALFLMIPFMILIYLEDRGPIFFMQHRIGANGKPFRMIKLRSMKKNAETLLQYWQEKQTPEWLEYSRNNFKLKQDPRLLNVGALIRKSSIDELPQLFNVLMGDMSLVGPRPLLPNESADYGIELRLYHSTRPGITGLWQVSGRSSTSFEQRANLDSWYIRNWSLGFDIIILLRTISVVLFSRGAF